MAGNLTAFKTAELTRIESEFGATSRDYSNLLTSLSETFGGDFSILDASTGEVLHSAVDHSELDWAVRGEICRAVARRGHPELVEDDDPIVSIAIPLITTNDVTVVAYGVFLNRAVSPNESMAELERLLGLRGLALIAWLEKQTPWSADALVRVARGLIARLAGERRLAQLEKEVDSLSLHLATTYEEISLLYRLTQNLKLSSKDEELGQLALEWLSEVLPVESLVIQFAPAANAGSGTPDTRTEPVLLTHGPSPINSAGFTALVDWLGLKPGHRPHVVNQSTTSLESWPFPKIRELIVIPLSEGNNIFGWLAVFNHVEGHEFGTVEASLLTSVAAILGIHSGNTELYRQQAEFFAGVVRALTSAIDAKDPYTCGHSNRVAQVAVRLSHEMGADAEQLNTIYLSGLLHDIGKIGIDDNVLRKPGRLTEAEYEHIKTHTEIGHRILFGLKQLDDVLPVVLHHHEQWDGKGYPYGLAGEEIPLMARIVAVADAFDAMGSDRPYRKGMPEDKLDAVLQEGAGRQWDARVIEAFFRARDDIREIWSRERRNLNLDVRQWM